MGLSFYTTTPAAGSRRSLRQPPLLKRELENHWNCLYSGREVAVPTGFLKPGCSPEKSSVIQLLGVLVLLNFKFNDDSSICNDEFKGNGKVGKL